MELKNIYTFLRVAELGSFTKAANELGYSQSTITVQIKQLENELGFLLFDRIGKSVSITSKGEEFIIYANRFARLEMEALNLGNADSSVGGALRVGVPESLLIWDLPRLITEYHELYPKVNLEVTVANGSNLYKFLRENMLDVIYLIDNISYRKDYIKEAISPVNLSFVTHPNNLLCRRQQLHLSEIAKEPLILTERNAIYRKCLDIEAARNDIELVPILEIESLELILRLVKMGMGISFMPNFTVQESLENKELALLDVCCSSFHLWSQVVYHKNKFISPQIEAFIQLIKKRQL
ncbi:LysR family transcriptional regulator [Cloacibacillus sp. An23]|uniref:LysR family transcriptional regulator n=1 Tax=Cloacibacillus sp. An23 TaxID=1965591 RepID=UPI001302AA7C|nr:LysR family transcriptional regulator [Cloacibacillus sp. An23]